MLPKNSWNHRLYLTSERTSINYVLINNYLFLTDYWTEMSAGCLGALLCLLETIFHLSVTAHQSTIKQYFLDDQPKFIKVLWKPGLFHMGSDKCSVCEQSTRNPEKILMMRFTHKLHVQVLRCGEGVWCWMCSCCCIYTARAVGRRVPLHYRETRASLTAPIARTFPAKMSKVEGNSFCNRRFFDLHMWQMPVHIC